LTLLGKNLALKVIFKTLMRESQHSRESPKPFGDFWNNRQNWGTLTFQTCDMNNECDTYRLPLTGDSADQHYQELAPRRAAGQWRKKTAIIPDVVLTTGIECVIYGLLSSDVKR